MKKKYEIVDSWADLEKAEEKDGEFGASYNKQRIFVENDEDLAKILQKYCENVKKEKESEK